MFGLSPYGPTGSDRLDVSAICHRDLTLGMQYTAGAGLCCRRHGLWCTCSYATAAYGVSLVHRAASLVSILEGYQPMDDGEHWLIMGPDNDT